MIRYIQWFPTIASDRFVRMILTGRVSASLASALQCAANLVGLHSEQLSADRRVLKPVLKPDSETSTKKKAQKKWNYDSKKESQQEKKNIRFSGPEWGHH